MDGLTRKRHLVDVIFVAGAVTACALLATFYTSRKPVAQETPPALPAAIVATPCPAVTPEPLANQPPAFFPPPTRNPFGHKPSQVEQIRPNMHPAGGMPAPMPAQSNRPYGGEVAPSHQR